MSKYPDLDELLEQLDAFIAGGQPDQIDAAEVKLGLKFPQTFKDYLSEWGNLSAEGQEYYGLTRSGDFDNSGVPNCVWYTLTERVDVGLPDELVIVRNDNGEQYICIECNLPGNEERIVYWDNIEREVDRTVNMTFVEFLKEELEELLE